MRSTHPHAWDLLTEVFNADMSRLKLTPSARGGSECFNLLSEAASLGIFGGSRTVTAGSSSGPAAARAGPLCAACTCKSPRPRRDVFPSAALRVAVESDGHADRCATAKSFSGSGLRPCASLGPQRSHTALNSFLLSARRRGKSYYRRNQLTRPRPARRPPGRELVSGYARILAPGRVL